jgi:glycine cleavage system H protein
MDPAKLRFTKTHEWASLTGGIVTIGVSKFAADQLNDITYIKLPDVGKSLNADESFGEIETVKAVSELYSPVKGEVVEVNNAIVSNPESLKEDPFGSSWLVKIKLAAGANLDHLQSYADYEKQVASEPH